MLGVLYCVSTLLFLSHQTMKNPDITDAALLWHRFATDEALTETQVTQFKDYFNLLTEWNKRINITRIVTLPDVLAYHFSDSLEFGRHIPPKDHAATIIDVGSGGGFPGIPLAIKYPQMQIILLEVTHKKVLFLEAVIKTLNLHNVTIDTRDWRTYLHHAQTPVDYVCARASLKVPDLMYVYTAHKRYTATQVVYWASQNFVIPPSYISSVVHDYAYTVGEKKRRLIFFKKPAHPKDTI